MNPDTVYQKSAKGHQEIATRACKLAAKPRALLILVDGRHSVGQLVGTSGTMDAQAILVQLEAQGFIEQRTLAAVETADPLSRARAVACELLHEALGPDADEFAMRLEQCQTREELLAYVEKYRGYIASTQGAAQGEAYVRKVQAELGVGVAVAR